MQDRLLHAHQPSLSSLERLKIDASNYICAAQHRRACDMLPVCTRKYVLQFLPCLNMHASTLQIIPMIRHARLLSSPVLRYTHTVPYAMLHLRAVKVFVHSQTSHESHHLSSCPATAPKQAPHISSARHITARMLTASHEE